MMNFAIEISHTVRLPKDIRWLIWCKYLNRFDRWMLCATLKYATSDKLIRYLTKNKLQHAFAKKLSRHGYLSALEQFHARGCNVAYTTFKMAARHGHVNILHWYEYIFNVGREKKEYIYNYAAEKGHVTVLNWLYSAGYTFTSAAGAIAGVYGHYEVLVWLCKHGMQLDDAVFDSAITGGNLAILDYLVANNCPWNGSMKSTIRLTPIKSLQWLKDRGMMFTNTKDVCAASVFANRTDILLWAHNEGLRWGANTAYEAVAFGKIDILEFAHEHGQKINYRAYNGAIAEVSIESLKWLDKNKIPMRDLTYTLLFDMFMENANIGKKYEKMYTWLKKRVHEEKGKRI